MVHFDMYGSIGALLILARTNPYWRPKDGVCQGCLEAAEETACEMGKARGGQGTRGFMQHYRHHLTRRESSQWHHRNAELRKGHRANIGERVALEARAAGYDSWLIFGLDEELLAQGCFTGEK